MMHITFLLFVLLINDASSQVERYGKLGIVFDIRETQYLFDWDFCNIHPTLIRLNMQIQDDQAGRDTYSLIVIGAQRAKRNLYFPSEPRETIFDFTKKPEIHRSVYFVCSDRSVPVLNNIASVLDHVFESNTRPQFSLNCDPCLGIRGAVQFRGKIQSFPMSARIISRSYTLYMTNLKWKRNRNTNNPSCVRNALAPPLIRTDSPECVASMYRDSEWNTKNLVLLNQERDNSLKFTFLNDDRPWNSELPILGVGYYLRFGREDYQSCYDDKNEYGFLNLMPFQPLILVDQPSVNGFFTSTQILHFHCFQYAGTNCQFRCTINNNVTRCQFSTIPTCADKYKRGPTCSEDISICSTNPCKNGGKCTGIETNYLCSCKAFTRGKHCEETFCDIQCFNRKCVGANVCGDCNFGWEGENCDIRANITVRSCGKGYQTIDNNRRICVCDPKISSGEFCEFECRGGCVNGICSQIMGQPVCVCDSPFIGDRCDRTRAEANKIIFGLDWKVYIKFVAYAVGLVMLIFIIYLIQIKTLSVNSFNIITGGGKSTSATIMANIQKSKINLEEATNIMSLSTNKVMQTMNPNMMMGGYMTNPGMMDATMMNSTVMNSTVMNSTMMTQPLGQGQMGENIQNFNAEVGNEEAYEPYNNYGVDATGNYTESNNYGAGVYGNTNYNEANYGDAAYGNTNYGDAAYANTNYGDAAYANANYGDATYGDGNYADPNYGNADYANCNINSSSGDINRGNSN